ncbi:MAG: beta-N-acetylhexosaminidase [Clostridia bacterium]|nr:beta-N-acetylhexosaminidase [Clostridia bacterium]
MRICFQNAQSLWGGIQLLQEELGIIPAAPDDAELTVCVTETEKSALTVSLSGKNAAIIYGGGKARFFRALATLMRWISHGKTQKTLSETPTFLKNGAMPDVSRNAVLTVEANKLLLRKMAMMGMNMYMLYTEDTYDVEGRPYFGYLRARYTADELREIDAYADALGIEVVPCVQMLGHLATHLHWDAAAPYRDTQAVMLAGAEETYRLLEDIFKTMAACLKSRRIHVGIDEAFDLGRGASIDKFGYRDRHEIFFAHLKRVIELSKAYGYEPMMWSDMFFRMEGEQLPGYIDYDRRVQFTDKIKALVPEGIRQVFWDYYNDDEAFYAENIDKHNAYLGGNVMFAGGVWLWSGHCPHYQRSLRNTVPALEACRKKGVSEVLATLWTNGSESSLLMALPGLCWYADYDYKGYFDEDSVRELFAFTCGADYDELMKCSLPETPDGGDMEAARVIFYNDPMLGMIDKHLEGLDTVSYYRDVTAQLRACQKEKGIFAASFEVIVKFSDYLENKANFGVRLREAYLAGDREVLQKMAQECDVAREKLAALRLCHRKMWHQIYKPIGWDAQDIRYGAMLARFDSAKWRILSYLNGEVDRLDELEEKRLRFDAAPDDAPRFVEQFFWKRFLSVATASTLQY